MQDNMEHTAPEFTCDAATHDAWFRRKVYEALADHSAASPHEQVETAFANRRSKILATLKVKSANDVPNI